MFPSRIAESFRRDDEEILRSGHPKLNIVELFFSDQGGPDWVVTHKMPLRDRRNRVIGVMGTVQSYESRRQVLQPYLQLDRAVAYLRENFRAGVTVKELSQVVHLSPRQLHRKFVETFGISTQAFIIKLRIQAACEALQREDSEIQEVARTLGFCDQSAFTQLFQKHVGLTPLQYQKRFRLRRNEYPRREPPKSAAHGSTDRSAFVLVGVRRLDKEPLGHVRAHGRRGGLVAV